MLFLFLINFVNLEWEIFLQQIVLLISNTEHLALGIFWKYDELLDFPYQSGIKFVMYFYLPSLSWMHSISYIISKFKLGKITWLVPPLGWNFWNLRILYSHYAGEFFRLTSTLCICISIIIKGNSCKFIAYEHTSCSNQKCPCIVFFIGKKYPLYLCWMLPLIS